MRWYSWKWWIFAMGLNKSGTTIDSCDGEWRSIFGTKLKVKIPKDTHDRCEYVTTGALMIIKCLRCGSESIPWRVTIKQAIEWRERHPDKVLAVESFESRRRRR